MSQRVPITTVSLKDRIAALGLQDRTTAQSTPLSQSTTPLSTLPSGFVSTSPGSSTSARVKDKAAQFEAIGGTPVPRGSFGLGAPPIFSKLKKTGELYGNRVPGSQPPPFGRQWPPGSYGSDTEGASPDLRSVSMPLRTNSFTGSGDGTTAGEYTIIEGNMDGTADNSTAPVARIQVVPPSPAFPPPEISRRISVDVSVPEPIVEDSISPLPRVDPAPVPDIPKTPPQPATDPVFDSNFTRSPSIHSHVSSPLASVEEEPVALDEDEDDVRASLSPEQPTLAYTPERIPKSITPIAASPKKKKTKRAPSPTAILSPPLTSPPLRPLRRSISARGRDRNPSISSTSGEHSVFTAPPVQGEDVGGGIHLSSTMETVERDGLGLELHADEDESGSEEEGVRRGEVPQDAEATGDVVGQSSIGESLESDMKGLIEDSKRDDTSIIEEAALKEQDDHSQGCERSNSSGTTDYTTGDAPSSATSPDIERPESITPPQLGDDSEADIGKLDEEMHPDVLPTHDILQAAAQDLNFERGSPRSPSDDVESTAREAIEPTKVPEINQPIQEKEDLSQESASSKPDAEDKQTMTSPVSPDSGSSFSLTFKDSISRAGLTDTGTASRARVLRELKQLGMEKRSSVELGPTRRTSVLSVVLPTSPEKLKFFSDSEKSPEQSTASPSTSTLVEIRPTDTPTSDKTSKPVIASPSEGRSPVSFGVAPSRVSPINESGKGVDGTSQSPPSTPPTRGSIAFPTPSTSASTSTGMSSRRSTDDLSYAPSFDSRRSSTSSKRHSSLYGAPTMPPPSVPLPPIPLSPPPPTPPPKDVPVSFGKMPAPKSFRELYSAGQLPPASRGPGMHQSAQGRPLLGRAISLSNRPLPALPNSNAPKRSTSAFVGSSSARMRTTSMHVPSLRTVPASPRYLPPEHPLPEKAYPTLVPYNPRLRTVSSPLAPRIYPSNEDTNHSRVSSSSTNQSNQTAKYQPLATDLVPSSYRSPSPTPSNYSDSQSGTVCSILSPDFDRRIFDAFPDVPRQLPDPTVLTRQASLGVSEPSGPESKSRTPVIAITIASPDGREGAAVINGLRPVATSTRAGASKARPVSMAYGEDASEVGQWAKQVSPVRERKKSTTRPLIPTWYDDDDYDENEAGWANVSVVRRQIA